MTWHGLEAEVLRLNHRPCHRYLDMRQEYRTSKGVASRPGDWLLLVLVVEPLRAALTKTDGKVAK
jgi:hypothetical protein